MCTLQYAHDLRIDHFDDLKIDHGELTWRMEDQNDLEVGHRAKALDAARVLCSKPMVGSLESIEMRVCMYIDRLACYGANPW